MQNKAGRDSSNQMFYAQRRLDKKLMRRIMLIFLAVSFILGLFIQFGGVFAEEDYTLTLNWVEPVTGSHLDLVGDNHKDGYQQIKYQVAFSSNETCEPGEMEIRLPQKINAYRDPGDSRAIFIDIGIPLAPNFSEDGFQYTLDPDTDEIVIRNAKKIDPANNNVIEISHKMVATHIEDSKEFSIKAKATFKGQVNLESQPITGQMDTKVIFTGAKAKVATSLVPDAPFLHTWTQYKKLIQTHISSGYRTISSDLDINSDMPADFDDYVYVLYSISAKFSPVSGISTENTSQPAEVRVLEQPSHGGEMVAYYSSNGFTKQDDGSLLYDWGYYTGRLGNEQMYSEQFALFTVVRYPKENMPADHILKNNVEITANPIDGVDEPVTHTYTADVAWKEYEYEYSGDLYRDSKSISGFLTEPLDWEMLKQKVSSNQELSNTLFSLTSDVRILGLTRGVEKPVHVMLDDKMYLTFNNDIERRLQPEDYYFHSLGAMILKEQTVDEQEGTIEDLLYSGELRFYGMSRMNPGVWELLFTIPAGTVRNSTTVWLNTYYSQETLQDKRLYRVKVEKDLQDSAYSSYLYLSPQVRLEKDSPTLAHAMENDWTLTHVRNAMGTYFTEADGTLLNYAGNYSGAASVKEDVTGDDTAEYGRAVRRVVASKLTSNASYTASSEKSIVREYNDVTHSKVDFVYGLSAYEHASPTMDVLKLAGLYESFERREAVFYDLLPPGIRYDASVPVVVKGINTGSAEDYEVSSLELIHDYKGSGRQMVVFHVKYTGVNANIFVSSLGVNSQTFKSRTGFYLEFGATCAWTDYSLSIGQKNYMAYQTETGMKGGAYPDNGQNGGAPDTNLVPTAGGEKVFYNLAGKDTVDLTLKNTLYASVVSTKAHAVSSSSGLMKQVREDSNLMGWYDHSARVALGETYSYRLSVRTSTTATMKGVILFDRLERGAVNRSENDTMDFEPYWWQGELLEVNTTAARMKGILPVVYYSDNAEVPYDLTDPSWTTDRDSLSSVKAVAVDLSQNSAGGEFTFGKSDGTYVTLLMKAPETMQSPARYAYNNAAFLSTTETGGGGTTTEVVSCASTQVQLYDKAPLEISKQVTGNQAPENQRFTFKVEINQEPYANKEYTLWTDNQREPGSHYTNAQGELTLKHNQKAIFDHTEVEDAFKVTEQQAEGFLVTPAGGVIEGSISPEGSKAAFTNRYTAGDTSLSVGKTVTVPNHLTIPTEEEFSFILKIDEVPYPGHPYTLFEPDGTPSPETLQTDGEGRFFLKHGQTAVFSQLPAGAAYEVGEEMKPGFLQVLPADGESVKGTLEQDAALNRADFVNTYKTYPFAFIKTNEKGEPLPNVFFAIHQCLHQHDDTCGGLTDPGLCNHTHTELVENAADGCWDADVILQLEGSDPAGRVQFDLLPGVYMLVETKTVDGYQLPQGQWMITVDAANGEIRIIAKGEMPPAFKYVTEGEGDQAVTTLYLANYPVMSMPRAGGMGVILLTVGGIMLLGSAGILFVMFGRKQNGLL